MVQKHYLNGLICCFIFLVCLFTTACSNNDKNSNETTFSGSAVKGIISDGIVSAYKINEQDNILITQSRTNASGQFDINIPSEYANDLILLELSTDIKTRMRCDLTTGCIDQNNGEMIDFGGTLSLPSSFKLYSVIEKQNRSAFISPLTHLIVSTAKSLDGTLTPQSINTASNWVTNALGLETSPTLVQLKDITHIENLSIMTDEELKQSIISAAMYTDTLKSTWADGNTSIDTIDMESMLSIASHLIDDLSTISNDTQHNDETSSLNRIQTQLDSQLESLSSSEIVILTQPSSISVNESQGFNLHVQANSDLELSYQWYKNDQEIPSATSAIYSKTTSDLNDTGFYKVVISNGVSTVTSLSVSVNINQLSDNLEIIQQPQGLSITEGDPILLTVSVNHDTGVSYQWQKNGSIIPSATSSSYFIANSQLQDEGSYRVTISNDKDQISSNFVNVWVSESMEPVSIISQPQTKTVSQGDNVTFYVEASGDGFLRYQWRKNGAALDNQFSNTLEISSASKLDEGAYDVIISNSQGSITSQIASLIVQETTTPISILQQPESQSVVLGQSFTLNVSAIGDNLNYQWFFNGDAIEGATAASFYVSDAGFENEGVYSVLISNDTSSQQSEISTISITAPISTSLELTWDTPTEREDGSPLSFDEIKGYIIEYGSTLNSLDKSITVENELPHSLILNDLNEDILYLRIATIDSDNLQGAFSETIEVSLQ